MASKYEHVKAQLEDFKRNNIYRRLLTTQVRENDFFLNGKKVINLCSNDYLGLSQNKIIVEKTKGSLKQISPCSSRLLSGNDIAIVELEEILALHRGSESALVYPTGYMGNLGAISAIATREHKIFSDELNHASIIDACKISNTNKNVFIFNHNDPDDLQGKLKKTKGKSIVITEGVFSMDGDIAKLDHLAELTKRYDAIFVVDDAHGDFVFGRQGNWGGIPEYFGMEKEVDIHISSLSKGLGCFGGYVASSNMLRDLFVNRSRQFIYTSAIPAHLCVSAINAISILKKNPNLQVDFFTKIDWFLKELKNLGFNTGSSSSQIVPIIIGDEKLAVRFSDDLFKNGIFVQAIRYPTVRFGESRLRISLNRQIEKNKLEYVLTCLETLGKKHKII